MKKMAMILVHSTELGNILNVKFEIWSSYIILIDKLSCSGMTKRCTAWLDERLRGQSTMHIMWDELYLSRYIVCDLCAQTFWPYNVYFETHVSNRRFAFLATDYIGLSLKLEGRSFDMSDREPVLILSALIYWCFTMLSLNARRDVFLYYHYMKLHNYIGQSIGFSSVDE